MGIECVVNTLRELLAEIVLVKKQNKTIRRSSPSLLYNLLHKKQNSSSTGRELRTERDAESSSSSLGLQERVRERDQERERYSEVVFLGLGLVSFSRVLFIL